MVCIALFGKLGSLKWIVESRNQGKMSCKNLEIFARNGHIPCKGFTRHFPWEDSKILNTLKKSIELDRL